MANTTLIFAPPTTLRTDITSISPARLARVLTGAPVHAVERRASPHTRAVTLFSEYLKRPIGHSWTPHDLDGDGDTSTVITYLGTYRFETIDYPELILVPTGASAR